jgi:hypothetical protein
MRLLLALQGSHPRLTSLGKMLDIVLFRRFQSCPFDEILA